MPSYILLLLACATYAHAQVTEVAISDDKIQCINQMTQWCDSMQYPQQGAGLAVLSITYEDPEGYYRVFCSADSEGTNCSKNESPWFACSQDHALTYKERILTNASKDVDDDICRTADKALNDLLVQNLSYENTTLKLEMEKGMEAVLNQISKMMEKIELMWKRLNMSAIFDPDKSIPFRGSDLSTDFHVDDRNASQNLNRI